MSALLIDSGVNSVAGLLNLLPPPVADIVDHDTLLELHFAAPLRLLATIRDEGWHPFIDPYRIDWVGLLAWVRKDFRTTDSVRVRVEIAASLAGFADSQALLLYGARALSEANYAALMDALRIARQGVSE